MEPWMDDFEAYKRLTSKCKCGCLPHCGHSCLNCDNCTECECNDCRQVEEFKGLN